MDVACFVLRYVSDMQNAAHAFSRGVMLWQAMRERNILRRRVADAHTPRLLAILPRV